MSERRCHGCGQWKPDGWFAEGESQCRLCRLPVVGELLRLADKLEAHGWLESGVPRRAAMRLTEMDSGNRHGDGKRVCEHCGSGLDPVPAGRPGPPPRFCGKPCRQAASRRRVRDRIA